MEDTIVTAPPTLSVGAWLMTPVSAPRWQWMVAALALGWVAVGLIRNRDKF